VIEFRQSKAAFTGEYLVAKLDIRRAVVALCFAGALTGIGALEAIAQQAPTAPAQPGAPAAQPAPAPLPPLPASHLALARQVMDASGVTANFEAIIGNVASQLLQIFVQKRPANTRDFEEILLSMKPELEAKKKELLDKASDVYARQLDENTLKTVLAFLETPAGKKYTAALPAVLNGVADATDAWTREIATQMGQRVVDEMKKRGVDVGR
jgi:hypothetical protein